MYSHTWKGRGNDSGSGFTDKVEQREEKGNCFGHPGNKPCALRLTRITCVYVCDGENAFFNLEPSVQSNSACTPRLNVWTDVPLRLSTQTFNVIKCALSTATLVVCLCFEDGNRCLPEADTERRFEAEDQVFEQLQRSEALRSLTGDKKRAMCQLALYVDLHTSHFKGRLKNALYYHLVCIDLHLNADTHISNTFDPEPDHHRESTPGDFVFQTKSFTLCYMK